MTLVLDPRSGFPDLAAAVGMPHALFLPLIAGERLGLLAIGYSTPRS
jgi:hypothetical protein